MHSSLGPYRILRELGSGGMGKVYAATVTEAVAGLAPGTPVALKVLHPHLMETPGAFKRFLREAEIGKSVAHANVVRTLDCDLLAAGGQPCLFLVMEQVEGQDLRGLQEELGLVPEELCRHIAREVCAGLAAIHAAGVVHRDLKPENVLITADQVVKVMDLGIAHLVDEALRLSRTGAFVGSIEYAAPEQFAGEGVDARTDLHALGILLYELAGGLHPYRGGDFKEVMHRVCHQPPRRLGAVNPQLSAFFEEVVHRLLAKQPGERFASAAELLEVIEQGEDSSWWHAHARKMRAATLRPLRRIRISRETAIYGRDESLEELESLHRQAESGSGQVVLIEGEAGIGKSRLVDELVTRLLERGHDLNFLWGSYPPGGAATAAGAFSSAYREHFGDDGAAAYLEQAPALIAAFDALLCGMPAPGSAEPLTQDSLQTCFAHVTRSLAAERTTIVLIEDLHFAPEEARSLFASLALAVPGHRVLLLGTMRPGLPAEWLSSLSRLDHSTRLELTRLGPKDLMRLLEDSFASEQLALQLAGQVALKSDGNPFFAFEILRGLREGNFIQQKADGTWVSTGVIDHIEIPSSVLDLVKARVADLTEEERDLLDVAACWGYEFDATLIGDALGVSRIPTLKRFAQLESKHRLVRCCGGRFAFDHHQVQEALHAALPPQLACEYHALLAEALERRTGASTRSPGELGGDTCVDLCEHFLASGRSERALRYLDDALTHLDRGCLNAQLLALAERALAEPGLLAGLERANTLLRLSSPLALLGRLDRWEESTREVEQIARESGDDRLLCRALGSLGVLYYRASRNEEAVATLNQALELAIALGDARLEAHAIGKLSSPLRVLGRLAEAEAVCTRALTYHREVGDLLGEARSLGELGIILGALDRREEARAHVERALEIFQGAGYRQGVAQANGNLGVLHAATGDFDRAREHMERSLELSREVGDRNGEAMALGNLGTLLNDLGWRTEAREFFERNIEICREIANPMDESIAEGNIGICYMDSGFLIEATTHFERGLALSREINDKVGMVTCLINLGQCRLQLGDPDGAREQHQAALEINRKSESRRLDGHVAHGLARVAEASGDEELAGQLLEESLTLRRDFDHAVGLAVSLLELGSWRRRRGERDEARALLAEARELSSRCGLIGSEVLAHCELAVLDAGEVDSAAMLVARASERVEAHNRRRAHLLLWKATGDPGHLLEARRLVDEALARVPAVHHDAMRTNVPVDREILSAGREEKDKEPEAADDRSDTMTWS